MNFPLLYNYPIWFTTVLFFGILLIAMEFGFWLGRWWQRRTPEAVGGGSGDIALTSMYAILGLVLAFTYSFAIGRADLRKQAVVAEANAIGTAFLRASLAPEPMSTELRVVLREYAGTRLVEPKAPLTQETVAEAMKYSLEVQARLWPITERMFENGGKSPLEVSIMQAVNDVIDMHSVRLAAVHDRLPGVALWMLMFVASVALAVAGYNRGLVGSMNRVRMTALALVLSVVMSIITDFDRGVEGLVQISHEPLEELIQGMGKIGDPPSPGGFGEASK